MTYLAQHLNFEIDFKLFRIVNSISGNQRAGTSTRANHCAFIQFLSFTQPLFLNYLSSLSATGITLGLANIKALT